MDINSEALRDYYNQLGEIVTNRVRVVVKKFNLSADSLKVGFALYCQQPIYGMREMDITNQDTAEWLDLAISMILRSGINVSKDRVVKPIGLVSVSINENRVNFEFNILEG